MHSALLRLLGGIILDLRAVQPLTKPVLCLWGVCVSALLRPAINFTERPHRVGSTLRNARALSFHPSLPGFAVGTDTLPWSVFTIPEQNDTCLVFRGHITGRYGKGPLLT